MLLFCIWNIAERKVSHLFRFNVEAIFYDHPTGFHCGAANGIFSSSWSINIGRFLFVSSIFNSNGHVCLEVILLGGAQADPQSRWLLPPPSFLLLSNSASFVFACFVKALGRLIVADMIFHSNSLKVDFGK